MRELSEVWKYKVRVNGGPTNFRERMGDFLRRLAGKIDYRDTLAISLESEPYLPRRTRLMCIKSGIDQIERSFKSEVHLAAGDKLFLRLYPELEDHA